MNFYKYVQSHFIILHRHASLTRVTIIRVSYNKNNVEASRSYSDTPYSVGLPQMSDQPVSDISTSQHTTFSTDIHNPGGIRTRNPSKRAAVYPRLRPRGQWYRQEDCTNVK